LAQPNFHRSESFEVRSAKCEVRSVEIQLHPSQFRHPKWTCRELDAVALIASQSADPSASPLSYISDSFGIRTLLFGSSGQRYTVSASGPSECSTLEIVTKKPGVTFGVTPGSPTFASLERPSVTSSLDARRGHSRSATRYNPYIH